MKELRLRVTETLNNINQHWVTTIRAAQKEADGEIDLAEMFGKFSEEVKKLDTAFGDAEERVSRKNKGGLFSRK